MPLLQPVAHKLRHRLAIHVKAVERVAGLWVSDESSSGRRALAGHSETIAPACRAPIGLNLAPVIPAILVSDGFNRRGVAYFHARTNRTSLTKLCGRFPLSCSTLSHDAHQHGEAPCRAGDAGELTAYADPEAESPFQLNRCHAWRLQAPSAMQFYSRGYGRAPCSKRAAQASRTGNEVQSNSQT